MRELRRAIVAMIVARIEIRVSPGFRVSALREILVSRGCGFSFRACGENSEIAVINNLYRATHVQKIESAHTLET